MKIRLMTAIALLVGLLLAMPAMSSHPSSVRKQLESSLRVSGTITVRADGTVQSHTIDPEAALSPQLLTFIEETASAWRFVPIMVDGKAVTARLPMYLRLVAKYLENGKVSVTIASTYFGSEDDVAPTDKVQSSAFKPPGYPRSALEMGAQGTVYLIVQVGRDGRVANADAEQVNLRIAGSKNEMTRLRNIFTAAAVRGAREWRFTPPTTGLEADQDSWLVRVPIEFLLREAGKDPRRKGVWETYIPGPRNMDMPWAQEQLKTAGSPDALPDNGVYPLRQGATLITPLG